MVKIIRRTDKTEIKEACLGTVYESLNYIYFVVFKVFCFLSFLRYQHHASVDIISGTQLLPLKKTENNEPFLFLSTLYRGKHGSFILIGLKILCI